MSPDSHDASTPDSQLSAPSNAGPDSRSNARRGARPSARSDAAPSPVAPPDSRASSGARTGASARTPGALPAAATAGWRARWRRSSAGRRATQVKRVCAAPLEFLRRRRAAADWLARTPPALELGPGGFARFGPGALPGVDSVLALARARLADCAPFLPRVHAGRAGGRKLTIDLFGDAFLAEHPELVDLVLQDAWLRPVVHYLRTVPFLARITLAHSAHVAQYAEPDYHQRFHLDNDDTRHVKLYVHVHDVAEEHGPVSFLPADASARVLEGLAREGRSIAADTTFSDADVFRHASPDELVRITGPAGSGVYADLSRCLHYGSRVQEGHDRTVVVAEFLRYHRLIENAANQFDPPRAEHDAVRRLALSPPVRHPKGTFLGDILLELGERG